MQRILDAQDRHNDLFLQEFDDKNLSKHIPSSARTKAIEERSKIQTGNYEEIDKHDQFYRDHKLLLHLFVVMGVVPVIRKVGHIEFHVKSYIFLYAIILYCITSTFVFFVGWDRMDILLNKSRRFDEYIYSIIFVVYLIPHFFIPYIGWAMGNQVCEYKNAWGKYQLKYYRVTGKGVDFPRLSILILTISCGCLILAIVFLMSLSALLAGFTLFHTTAYYHIITMLNMNCALWYINCRAMGDASKCFADCFEEDMEEHCNAYILYKYRVLWLDLSDMLQRLGNTYARTYSMYSLFTFINITIAVYGFISEVLDHGFTFSFKEIGLFVNSVYCIALLYIFCDCSEKATNNISKRVQDTLMTINMNNIDPGAKKEIDLFLVAIQMNPPVVSMQGYGDVDKKFFTSSVTMIAIYLVVLIQFKLTPDIKYIINLVVQKQQNGTIKTDKQQIILDCIGKTNKKSTMTAYLSGPEIIYSDMLYTAKAEVNSCTDTFDYQLSWQLLDKSNKMVRKESTKSHILHLGPGSLSAGKEYSIICIVLDKKNKKNRTSEALRVTVLERGMQLSTYTKMLKIGPNQPIYLNAFFNDPDGIAGRLMFEWKCKTSANEDCTEFESSNTTELLIKDGFSNPGRYRFTVTAKKGDRTVQDSSTVDVTEEMLPVIDVENAMTSCNPSDAVAISALVTRLAPECTLQWTSEKGQGYVVVDLTKVPGTPGKLLKIEDEESSLETFSEENNDEDETFIDKQFDFLLPTSADDSWIGLKDDSKYLFRLTALCPCLENITAKKQEKFVISSADIVVKTNKLPVIKPLKVIPKSGQAIRTAFNFQTGEPYNSTRPLLYKFGIINKFNKKLFLVEQYDITSADTILPFYDESIQTILEVCDSKRACNFTLGPKVIVKLPNNFTEAETKSLLNDFKKSIIEQDYFNAFTLSSMFLQTASQLSSNETLSLFDSVIKNITKQEIQLFLSATDDAWLLPATSLLKHIKILDNDIHFPQDLLNDILALRDKVSEKQNSLRKKQIKSEKLVAPSRKLLSLRTSKKSKRIVNDINIDDIKNYLEISEMAIKRLTEFERVDTEVQKLRDQLQYYIPTICQYLYKNNYKTNVRIELSTIVLDVERINLVRKYNEFMFVPFEMNLAAKLQLGRDLAEKYRRKNGLCLGKILFLADYFHIPQYVFDVKLYSATSDYYMDSEVKNFGTVIEMPVKSVASSNQMFQCVLLENGDWNMNKCKTLDEYAGKVKCACRSLGYFSMVPVERTTTTSTTTRSSTSRAKPAQSHELVSQQYNAETTVSTTVSTTVTVTHLNLPITNEPSHATVLQSTIKYLITSTEQTTDQKDLYRIEQKNNDDRNVNSAAVWSISLLSIGIFTLLLAFLVLLRKLQRSKAVQSFQTIEYAKYFDEHNLE